MSRKYYKTYEQYHKVHNTYRSKRRARDIINATNGKQPWSDEDIDLIMNSGLPLLKLQELTGRTSTAIMVKRNKEKKKWKELT